MPRPATDLRARILEAARELFAKQGVDGASMRAVARRSRTSIGMIAYHFESKDGLFRAVVDDLYGPFLADLEAIAAAERDPLKRLIGILGRIARTSETERQSIRVLLREASVMSPRLPYVVQRFLGGHVRLIVEALMEARAAGLIRDIPPMASLPALLGPIVMPQLLWELMGPVLGVQYEGVFRAVLDVILHGLVPRT